MSEHHLKTHYGPFRAIRSGIKGFEFRKNDRDFRWGDTLFLEDWDPTLEEYSGEVEVRKVDYMLEGCFGIPDGYCIMSWNQTTALKAAHQDCVSKDVHEAIERAGQVACQQVSRERDTIVTLRAELESEIESRRKKSAIILEWQEQDKRDKTAHAQEVEELGKAVGMHQRIGEAWRCKGLRAEKAEQSLDSIRESLKPLCLNQETLDGCVSAVVARLQGAEQALKKYQDIFGTIEP